MNAQSLLTSKLISLSLCCLPIAQAEEKDPNISKVQESLAITVDLAKSEQAIATLKNFEATTKARNFEILKAANPIARLKSLAERDIEIVQVIKDLSKLYNLPVPEQLPKLSPKVYEELTLPLVKAIFQDKKTILFPRSLILDQAQDVVLYSLPVTIAENYQEEVKSHEYQIAGLLTDNKRLPVSIHKIFVPFFEVAINRDNEALISQLPTRDFSLTNETGAVIFKDCVAAKVKAAYQGMAIPINIIEHSLAVRIATYAMVDMSPHIPASFKLDQKEFSKAQLIHFIGDYKFLTSSRGLSFEYQIYDLRIAESTRDSAQLLNLQIIKKALHQFINDQEHRGSPLNELIGKEIGNNQGHYPAQIATLKADLEKKPTMKILTELFELSIKHKTPDFRSNRTKLMESFYSCYLNTMADELDRIRDTIQN